MAKIRDLVRNIKPQEVIPQEQPLVKEPPKPLEWPILSNSLILLRSFELEGSFYYVFFLHTPTVFKTRGKYKIVQKGDTVTALQMLELKNVLFMNFTINDFGEILQKEDVPFLNLAGKPEFINIYNEDNTKVEIRDLLDLLDFIHLLGGYIHMNPLKEVPKLTNTRENGGKFKLGEIKDYQRQVHEFITSKEKPTLSYRYLVNGYELENGIEIEKKKFFQYPLLTNTGEVGVDELEFTVPFTEENMYYIDNYIANLIVPNSKGIYKDNRIYFIVDTSKLNQIRTLHEVPVSAYLVHDREKSRLLLKSLTEFKRTVKNLAKRVGTPIRELNMYSYDTLEKVEGEAQIIDKVLYSSVDTKAGDTQFKVILEKSGVKTMGYVENLIEKYLEGRLDPGHLEKHIINSDRVFKYQSLNEALKILFSSIQGRNLTEMFELTAQLMKALEIQSNSLKIRLHVFKSSDGEMEGYLLRALSHLPVQSSLIQPDFQTLTYKLGNDEFEILIKTEIKY